MEYNLILNKLLITLSLATAQACMGAGVTLIDFTFDNTANDIGNFQQVSNGVASEVSSSDVATGVVAIIATGTPTYGFNSTALVDVGASDPTATGFTATFYVSAGPNVGNLDINGYFLGLVSGNHATATGGTGLFNNDTRSFGYNTGSTHGENIMYQEQEGASQGITTSLGAAPTNASYLDGFTLSISMFDDDTWSISSTGLSTNLSATGSLSASEGTYADFAEGVGLNTTLQSRNVDVGFTIDRMTLTTVPEPASYAALIGLAALGIVSSRRQ